MKVVVVILLIHCLLGEAVKLQVQVGVSDLDGKSTVTIRCTEEANDRNIIGEVTSLAIQTVATFTTVEDNVNPGQVTRRYLMKPVVELGVNNLQTWGAEFDIRSRSVLRGSIGIGEMSLFIREYECKDNGLYLCVAAGPLGTVDSSHVAVRGFSNVERAPDIKGGRRCPSLNAEPADRCDIYAVFGETVALKCRLKVELTLDQSMVQWLVKDGNGEYEMANVVTMVDEPSPETCEVNLTSTVQYRHVPWQSDDVSISCHVTYAHPNTSMLVKKSVQLRVCSEDELSKAYAVTGGELAGVFLAGVVGMIILILIMLTCVACCGHKVKLYKKNKIAVTRM